MAKYKVIVTNFHVEEWEIEARNREATLESWHEGTMVFSEQANGEADCKAVNAILIKQKKVK